MCVCVCMRVYVRVSVCVCVHVLCMCVCVCRPVFPITLIGFTGLYQRHMQEPRGFSSGLEYKHCYLSLLYEQINGVCEGYIVFECSLIITVAQFTSFTSYVMPLICFWF